MKMKEQIKELEFRVNHWRTVAEGKNESIGKITDDLISANHQIKTFEGGYETLLKRFLVMESIAENQAATLKILAEK